MLLKAALLSVLTFLKFSHENEDIIYLTHEFIKLQNFSSNIEFFMCWNKGFFLYHNLTPLDPLFLQI